MASASPDLRSLSQPQSITSFDQYQVILLGNGSTQVYVAGLRLLCNGAEAELEEPATYKSQVQCPAFTLCQSKIAGICDRTF